MGQLCSGKISQKELSVEQPQKTSSKHNSSLPQNSSHHYEEQKINVLPVEEIKQQSDVEQIIENNEIEQIKSSSKIKKEVPKEDGDQLEESKKEKLSDNSKNKEYKEEYCIICLERFDELGEDPSMTTCGHCFCHKCLTATLKMKPFCPLCRKRQPRNLYEEGGEEFVENNEEDEPLEDDWNIQIVRAHINQEPDENGYRRVVLSNGEQTNVFIGQGAKINIAPGTNLVINGKRIENTQDCNVQ